MSAPDEAIYSGQPYSGRNRIPNIKQFVEGLDRDKKRRDAKIDAQLKEQEEQQQQQQTLQANSQNGNAVDHIPLIKPGKNRRTIRDPVTGKDVEIEDIDSKHVKTAENRTFLPSFSLPPPSPLPRREEKRISTNTRHIQQC